MQWWCSRGEGLHQWCNRGRESPPVAEKKGPLKRRKKRFKLFRVLKLRIIGGLIY